MPASGRAAIALANGCEYGLTSSVYTRSLGKAMQGYHAGVRKSGIAGTDGKHGL